jgi:hypothetical protein
VFQVTLFGVLSGIGVRVSEIGQQILEIFQRESGVLSRTPTPGAEEEVLGFRRSSDCEQRRINGEQQISGALKVAQQIQ